MYDIYSNMYIYNKSFFFYSFLIKLFNSSLKYHYNYKVLDNYFLIIKFLFSLKKFYDKFKVL